MADPLLSVTVANYNYARYLPQTIESILGQTFRDFELILIDNASTDDSVEVMRRYEATDPRVRVIVHAENEGMFASYRESWQVSRGRYRVPVEADDWIMVPDAFETQVRLLEAHPSMTFVYPSLTMTEPDGAVIHVSRPYDRDTVLPGEIAVESVLTFNVTHTGMMCRLDAVGASGGYNEQYRHIADIVLGVRLCELGDVGYIDRSLYGFRQHGSNLNVQPQLEVLRNEILPAIDEAFGGPLRNRLGDRAAKAKRRVTRLALTHLPTQYIFRGDVRTGWRLWWQACRSKPLLTIGQPRTVGLLARTLLGSRRYQWLARRLGRGTSMTSG